MSLPSDTRGISPSERLSVGGKDFVKELDMLNQEGAERKYALTKREHLYQNPDNGGSSNSYTIGSGQSEIEFILTKSTGLLDCQSCALTGEIVAADIVTEASEICVLEHVGMLINRVEVLVGEQKVEDVQNHDLWLPVLKRGAMAQDYARAQYSWAHFLEDRQSFQKLALAIGAIETRDAEATSGVAALATKTSVSGSSNVPTAATTLQSASVGDFTSGINYLCKLPVKGEAAALQKLYQSAGSSGLPFILPLWHLGFFQQERFFPYGLANVKVILHLNTSLARTVTCSTGVTATAGVLKLNSPRIMFVNVIPERELYASIINAQAQTPLVFNIDTYTVQQTSHTFAGTTEEAVNLSWNFGRRFLKSVHVWNLKTATLTDADVSKTVSPYLAPNDSYFEINAEPFPRQRMKTAADVYRYMTDSYNNMSSVDAANSISYDEWTDTSRNMVNKAAGDESRISRFQMGYSFEGYQGVPGSFTGLNTASQENSNIFLRSNLTSPEAVQTTFFAAFRHLRMIRLEGGMVSVR